MLVQIRERVIRAFYELEEVKHIDKITAKDVVEQCGLTRKTFYYYFRDIYDLMNVIIDRELEKLLEEDMTTPTPEKTLRRFFRYLLPRQGHLERIMESHEHMMLVRVMFDEMYRYFPCLIEKKGEPLSMKKDEMDLATHFFTYGILGILIERKFQIEEDIDKIVNQLIRLIKGRRTVLPELFSGWCPKAHLETRAGICWDLYSTFINTGTRRQRAGPPTRPCI